MLPLALSFFETLLNRTIKFDPHLEERLAGLEGKCLSVDMTDLKLKANIFFKKNTILLKKNVEKTTVQYPEADVRICANLAALLAFVGSKEIKQAIDRGLIIEGDMETANEIQHFITALDIDWEEMLSRCTGDVVAYQCFNFFKKMQEKKQDMMESLSFSAGNFFQEECRVLPTAIEVETFNRSVDDLRNAVERIEARLQIIGSDPL